MLRKTIFALLIITPLSALAHPGEHHHGLSATMIHLLTEPDHLIMAAIAIAIAAWGARCMRARKAAKKR